MNQRTKHLERRREQVREVILKATCKVLLWTYPVFVDSCIPKLPQTLG